MTNGFEWSLSERIGKNGKNGKIGDKLAFKFANKKTGLLCCLLLGATLASGCVRVSASATSTQVVAQPAAVAVSNVPTAPAQSIEKSKYREVGTKTSEILYQAPIGFVLEYPKFQNEAINLRIQEILGQMKMDFEAVHGSTEEKQNERKSRQQDCEDILHLTYESYLFDEDKLCLVFHESYELPDVPYVTGMSSVYFFDFKTGEAIPQESYVKDGFKEAASNYIIGYIEENEEYRDNAFGNYKELLAPEAGWLNTFGMTDDNAIFYLNPYDLFPGSMGMVRIEVPFSALEEKVEDIDEGKEAVAPTGTRIINPDKPMVALTFDDGPHPVHTEAILDTLEEYGVVATFFDLGNLVATYPSTVQREQALGCEIASHSYSHKHFTRMSESAIKEDTDNTNQAFMDAIGTHPTLFRPPYGDYNEGLKALLPMGIVTWSIDTLDWKSKNVNEIMKVIEQSGNLDGDVILMHGIYSTSAEATEEMIPYLLEKGYQLVTVSELLEYHYGEESAAGELYGYGYFK